MSPEVRLTGPENEPLGVVSLMEALRQAGELDVDLVEISPTANPPVCRLMDYGKFKYQEQKKAAEAKAKQTVIEIKEIKFRPGTDDGDYNIKMRNIKRFLADGDKCKITLRYRGREITHQEIGMALLNRIRAELGDTILVEQFPKLEGRQMIMMIAPGKKKLANTKAGVDAPVAQGLLAIAGAILGHDLRTGERASVDCTIVQCGQAFKRHILTKKTTKNKRQLRGSTAVHETNMGSMAQMLPGFGI